jgi:hypothetical protein
MSGARADQRPPRIPDRTSMIAQLSRSTIVALTVSLALGGCSQSTGPFGGDITLTASSDAYPAGSIVDATMSNRSFYSVSFGECPRRIERLTGGRWIEANAVTQCLSIGYSLPPGTDAPIEYRLPSSLESGTYRIAFEVQHATGQREFRVRSRPFVVNAVP